MLGEGGLHLHMQTPCPALPLRGQPSSELSSGGAWDLPQGLGQRLLKALGLVLSCGLAQACVQGAKEVPLFASGGRRPSVLLVVLSCAAWPSLPVGKEVIFRTSAVWPEGSSRPTPAFCWPGAGAQLSSLPCLFLGTRCQLGAAPDSALVSARPAPCAGLWAAAGVLEEWAG